MLTNWGRAARVAYNRGRFELASEILKETAKAHTIDAALLRDDLLEEVGGGGRLTHEQSVELDMRQVAPDYVVNRAKSAFDGDEDYAALVAPPRAASVDDGEVRPWHESLNPAQLCIASGPTTLRDPDTEEWRVELTYTFAGTEYRVGGEDVTERKAVLRMLDSLKTSIEARHPDALDAAEGQGRR